MNRGTLPTMRLSDPAVCPTPGKRGFGTKHNAKKRIAQLRSAGSRNELRAYLCPCGVFHIGHKPGTLYRQKKRHGTLDA